MPTSPNHPEVGQNLALESSGVTPEERMSVLRTLKRPGWLKTEVLAGLVVALALIPEAIAFSLIAGVDPTVGLYATSV
ncbi:MAG TPA: SulP family inorganic anion transporter, partial [Citricoccus sp.]